MTIPLLNEQQLAGVLTLQEFEFLAPRYLTESAFEYARGGVADEITLTANRAAFNGESIVPRVLRDVSRIDTSLSLFGQRHDFPILLAPTGYHKLFHPEGELATVRGALASGAQLIASTFSTVAFEEMSAAAHRSLWFQLYVQPDREITRGILSRVLEAGCQALCLTVDVPVNGPRDRDLSHPFALPQGVERANLSALGPALAAAAHRPQGRNIYTPTRAANLTWGDVEWLHSISKVPLLIKGIIHPEDALAAADCGCDGLIVSNHGGRSLDTVPATLDILPRLADAVGSRMPLLMDGGIRRGTDVFKAIAKGAAAVLIGRPYLYGLAVGGPEGVARAVNILRTEFEMTMALAGCSQLGQIKPDSLWYR